MSVFDGRELHHVGFLVRDVDAVSSVIGGKLGCSTMEPFELQMTDKEIEFGEPGSLRILLARMGNVLMEFMQPLGDGPSVWVDELNKRGPGIHHIAFTQIDNYESTILDLRALGCGLTVAGHFGDDRWCYLEIQDLVLELANGLGPVFEEK